MKLGYKFTVRISEDLLMVINEISYETKLNKSEVIRGMIADFCKKWEDKKEDEFNNKWDDTI